MKGDKLIIEIFFTKFFFAERGVMWLLKFMYKCLS